MNQTNHKHDLACSRKEDAGLQKLCTYSVDPLGRDPGPELRSRMFYNTVSDGVRFKSNEFLTSAIFNLMFSDYI